MSKAIVDGIIRSSLNRNVKRFDTLARKYSAANNPHHFRLTEEDFRNTIVKNFTAIMSKIVNGDPLENPKVRSFLEKVAKKVFKQYAKKYVLGKGESINVYPTYILLYQPSLRENKLKAPIFDIALPLIRRGFKNILKGSADSAFGSRSSQFTRRTQFLHIGKETSGTEGMRLLGNTVTGRQVNEDGQGPRKVRSSEVSNKTIESNIERSLKASGASMSVSTSQAREAGKNVIVDMLRRLDIKWESGEKQKSNDYRKKIDVFGTVGPSVDNRPGSESYDWINLRAQMEKEVAEALFKDVEDFANKAASMSPVEKLKRIAINQVIDAFGRAQNKNFKVKAKKEKVPKAKRDKSRGVGQPNKKNTRLRGGAIAVGAIKGQSSSNQATKKKGAPRSNLLRLQAILNAKLPAEVRKNMGAPALENRSGAFAGSVRITDISTTAKGFPSIGYTYDKNPYQIFEMGKGKTPWASAQRDPRKLIDRSIREIASEQLVGRFFTRRM